MVMDHHRLQNGQHLSQPPFMMIPSGFFPIGVGNDPEKTTQGTTEPRDATMGPPSLSGLQNVCTAYICIQSIYIYIYNYIYI